jgi:hypothetical protein
VAGRGQVPKANPQDGGARRQLEWTELGGSPVKGAPALGKRPGGGAWLPEVRAWWETWRRAPMASQFIATDWLALKRAAFLLDQLYRGEGSPSALAGEVRQIEGKLGATVGDRLQLRLRVRGSSSPPAPDGDAPAPVKKPKGRDTRRLQVVS